MSDVSVMMDEIGQMIETLEAGARDAGYEHGVADTIDLMYQEAARSHYFHGRRDREYYRKTRAWPGQGHQ